MVKSLQSIRFIFALMIFLHHAVFPISALGAFPVTFFLILSGFVLMKGNNGGIDNQSQYMPFFLKRVRKIYPVHILCLVLAIVVTLFLNKQIDWISIIPNVFLIHGWIPDSRFYFSGNSVSWYLSVIVFCYAMFPFLAEWIKRLGWKFVTPLVVFYLSIMLIIPDNYVHKFLYINPLFRVVDFCLGIWLYILCTYERKEGFTSRIRNLTFMKKTIIEIIIFVISFILIILSLKMEKRFVYACFWWLPSLTIIYIFFMYDRNGGLISKMLNNKILVFMGSLSFVFYMLHIQILIINDYLMDNVISMNYYLNGVVVLLITIGLSYLVTYYYMPLFKKNIV